MLISFILSFFLFYEINNNKDGVQNSVKLIPYDVSNLISLNFINSTLFFIRVETLNFSAYFHSFE